MGGGRPAGWVPRTSTLVLAVRRSINKRIEELPKILRTAALCRVLLDAVAREDQGTGSGDSALDYLWRNN